MSLFFHGHGTRYITLAHAKSNHLADSSFDAKRTWNGLSPFGREVVAEMNRLGMMIDVSHLSAAASEWLTAMKSQIEDWAAWPTISIT